MRVEGKVALVTGGAKRIGRAIALDLAAHGAEIALHYFQSAAEAEETKNSIEKLGRRCEVFCADLRRAEAPSELAAAVLARFSHVDILINNASSFPSPERLRGGADLLSETPLSWHESLAVNAQAPFFLIQALASSLERNNEGLVVNLLDRSVEEVWFGRVCHTISKRALREITEIAAQALHPKIQVKSLTLDRILLPDDATNPDLTTLSWSGVEGVTEEIRRLITER